MMLHKMFNFHKKTINNSNNYIESNVKIAIFMNMDIYTTSSSKIHIINSLNFKCLNGQIPKYFTKYDLEFHKNWNWIIRVLSKIEKKYKDESNDIVNIFRTLDIEKVYEYCINIINKYAQL